MTSKNNVIDLDCVRCDWTQSIISRSSD